MEPDHEMTDEIVCPYCGAEYQDSWEFKDDDGVMDCIKCEKEFSYRRYVDIAYSTGKLDKEDA